jgi:hypothetical protein
MEKVKNINLYETKNVDLAAFLMFEGVKFLECRTERETGKDLVIMRFFDDKTICRDLERVFMTSDFKKYRDLTKYLLKEIHNKLREKM